MSYLTGVFFHRSHFLGLPNDVIIVVTSDSADSGSGLWPLQMMWFSWPPAFTGVVCTWMWSSWDEKEHLQISARRVPTLCQGWGCFSKWRSSSMLRSCEGRVEWEIGRLVWMLKREVSVSLKLSIYVATLTYGHELWWRKEWDHWYKWRKWISSECCLGSPFRDWEWSRYSSTSKGASRGG